MRSSPDPIRRPRIRPIPAGPLPALLLAVAVGACGGGEAAPGATRSTPAGARTGESAPLPRTPIREAAPDVAQRPPRPPRNFASRYTPFGPWYEALAARVDPRAAEDPWPTETVANLFRRVFLGAIEARLAGEEARFEEFLDADSELVGRLRPTAPERVVDDGALRVEVGPAGAETLRGIEPVLAALDELVAPHRGRTEVRADVWVTASWTGASGLFELRGSARIATDRGAGTLQTNFAFAARLQVIQGRLRLARLAASDFVEVESEERAFAELTGTVLGADARWIRDGALERTGRTDRLVVFTDVYLGMHGLAVGDVDGDGLEDVYVARQGGLPNLLLRHRPDGTVEDVAAAAGVDLLDDTGGVLVVDLDGDGARDLALGVGGAIALLWNDGAGAFPTHTILTGESRDRVYSLAAADADGDGDLDLYDTRYFTGEYGGGAPAPYHDAENGARNAFWRNEGERAFVDATAEVGLEDGNDRFSLSALWEDVDDDGDLDLYVVNDFGRNNLYLNEEGRFRDAAAELGLGDMAAGMGISAADVDLDGRLDLYVSNMYTAPGSRVTANPKFMPHAPPQMKREYQRHTRGNTLLVQEADGRFHDVTDLGATAPGGWAWGAMFLDVENDGLPDVFVPNGFTTGRDPRDLQSFFWRVVVNASPLAPPATEAYMRGWQTITRLSQRDGYSWNGNERNYAYKNLGGRRFADVSAALGLDAQDDARVAAVVDWDGDGRLDLWVKNRTAPLVRFLRNVHPAPGQALRLELVGAAPNPDAVGARVEVFAGGVTHKRTVRAGEGFLGGSSRRIHVGLGATESVERVRVRWPDGSTSEHVDVSPGGLWRLRQAPPGQSEVAAELVAGPAPSPLEGRAAQPLPSTIRPPDPRVVALERLPYSDLPLPRFDGPDGRVADHAGRPLLVVLWASWDEDAARELGALAGARDTFAGANLALHPISADGPRDEAYARALARSVGLAEPGGRADRRVMVLIELALQAVLQPYEDLALPLGLLFDPRGRLVAVYVGELDAAVLAEDARRASVEDEDDELGRTTLALTGGHWLVAAPGRPLVAAIEFLRRERGEEALADELEAFDAARR